VIKYAEDYENIAKEESFTLLKNFLEDGNTRRLYS
jgi:hypothetical protein